mmetsp:Transcript_5534/g.13877  ORF Transcript_5534/g.13877 Transcript_5534/m.13877 type:complete len:313 (-) Transcript_5534:1203-2141(-)
MRWHCAGSRFGFIRPPRVPVSAAEPRRRPVARNCGRPGFPLPPVPIPSVDRGADRCCSGCRRPRRGCRRWCAPSSGRRSTVRCCPGRAAAIAWTCSGAPTTTSPGRTTRSLTRRSSTPPTTRTPCAATTSRSCASPAAIGRWRGGTVTRARRIPAGARSGPGGWRDPRPRWRHRRRRRPRTDRAGRSRRPPRRPRRPSRSPKGRRLQQTRRGASFAPVFAPITSRAGRPCEPAYPRCWWSECSSGSAPTARTNRDRRLPHLRPRSEAATPGRHHGCRLRESFSNSVQTPNRRCRAARGSRGTTPRRSGGCPA